MFGDAICSACYVNEDEFHDLEEFHDADIGEELWELVNFLLCNRPYNARALSDLENKSHNVFEPNDMSSFCDSAKTLITPCGPGRVSCSALLFSSWWGRLQYLTEGKKFSSVRKSEEVKMKEERALLVEPAPFFYICAPGQYPQKH